MNEQLQLLTTATNILWLILAGFLVFFMQAGFALVETPALQDRRIAGQAPCRLADEPGLSSASLRTDQDRSLHTGRRVGESVLKRAHLRLATDHEGADEALHGRRG